MTKGVEFDFLTWRSFPSSLKLYTDEPREKTLYKDIAIFTVQKIRDIILKVSVKGTNILPQPAPYFSSAGLNLSYWDGRRWVYWAYPKLPVGTYDWTEYTRTISFPPKVPEPVTAKITYTSSSPDGSLITVWLDNLRIYQNGKLIYENNFSNWSPYFGSLPLVVIGGVVGFNEVKKLIRI